MSERVSVKCAGKNCPNGGATSVYSDDTLWHDGRYYCSACRKQVEHPTCPHCGRDRESYNVTCLRSECQEAEYIANRERARRKKK